MEYEINAFTAKLRDLFFDSKQFPFMESDYINKYGYSQIDKNKHPNRNPLHLKQAAEVDVANSVYSSENMVTFNYGSEMFEKIYPYYHILQQAPVIRKAHKGTKKSKGSQANIEDVSKRDYERVSWNGKTFTKEYSRNVRGNRVSMSKVSRWERFGDIPVFVQPTANSYVNIHYRYIDKILDEIAPQLAELFGLRLGRKQNTGLGDEYSLQTESEYTMDITDIFDSFN